MNKKRLAAALVAFIIPLAGAGTAGAGAKGPTCSEVLDITVHGQHVVGDYVTGLGHEGFDPSGGVVGAAVSSNRGAVLPGGPVPAFHFEKGIAPGASFCTSSNSPGAHL